jgi:Tfp pilus assembly protein PilF
MQAADFRTANAASETQRSRRHHSLGTACLAVLLGVCVLGASSPLPLQSPAGNRELQRGKEAFQQKEYGVALKAFGEAIQLQPGDIEAYLFRARVYQQLQQWDLAVKELLAVQERWPSGRVAAAIGYCHHMARDTRLSFIYAQEAIRIGYRSPDVLTNLGMCHSMRGHFDESEKYFQEALEKDPNLRGAHWGLAIVYFNAATSGMRKPIPKAAYFHARKAVELGPPSRQVYLLCGGLAFRAEQVAQIGVAANQAVLSAFPDAAERRRGLEYLRQAIAHGEDPREIIAMYAKVPSLQHDKAFLELLTLSPGNEPSIRCHCIVNPLEYHAPAASDKAR